MFSSLVCSQGCIFFYNPPQGGGKESKALKAREENQRRVKKKGRDGKGRRKGRKRGKGRKKKKIRVQKEMKEEKNMRGKEMKKMDNGANTKERRNLGLV